MPCILHFQVANSTEILVLFVVVEAYFIRFAARRRFYKFPIEDTIDVMGFLCVWVRGLGEVVIYASVYVNVVVIEDIVITWRVFSAAEGNVVTFCRDLRTLHAILA